jgi:hypothetical protein
MGMGGKQPPYIYFENNGGLGTMGKESIVLNNEKNNRKNDYCPGQ